MCILVVDRIFMGYLHGKVIDADERSCRETCFQFTVKPDIGWIHGSAALSGIILCVILLIIMICSMQWIRRGGHFQVSARIRSVAALPVFVSRFSTGHTYSTSHSLSFLFFMHRTSGFVACLSYSEVNHALFRNGLSVHYRYFCWKRRTHC